MKKFLAFVMAASMALSLAACGGSSASTATSTTTEATSEAAASTSGSKTDVAFVTDVGNIDDQSFFGKCFDKSSHGGKTSIVNGCTSPVHNNTFNLFHSCFYIILVYSSEISKKRGRGRGKIRSRVFHPVSLFCIFVSDKSLLR